MKILSRLPSPILGGEGERERPFLCFHFGFDFVTANIFLDVEGTEQLSAATESEVYDGKGPEKGMEWASMVLNNLGYNQNPKLLTFEIKPLINEKILNHACHILKYKI